MTGASYEAKAREADRQRKQKAKRLKRRVRRQGQSVASTDEGGQVHSA